MHLAPSQYSKNPGLFDRFRGFFLPALMEHHTQASNSKNLTLVIPSDYLAQGTSFSFGLTVTTDLGGSGEASVTIFKSSQELPALKVGVRGH